jgi:hypothetical protein
VAITTFAELKTAMSNWLDVPSGQFATNQLDDLVMIGEKWINRNVRATEMETAMSVAISGSGTATVPTGFLGLKNAYVDGTPTQKLYVVSIGQLLDKYPMRSSDSKPKFVAYDVALFQFGPFPDSTYTVKGTYYKRQGPLSSSVYDLFSNNPDLFLFAALCESEPVFGRDERMPMWKAKRDEIAQQINVEAQGIGLAGGMAITTA